MNYEEVSRNVDEWISDNDLPARADIKPIRLFSGVNYEYEEPEEMEAWKEFIHWNMGREHQILKLIPREEYERDFWTIELDEDGDDVSAFNTMDFQRNHRNGFSMYHWQLKRLCKTVKDWAITYSIIKDEIAKEKIRNRAIDMIRDEGKGLRETLFQVWLEYAYSK